MRILHMNAGAEDGGGKTHIISLLDQFPTDEVELAVFEDGIVAREAREIGIKVHVFSQKSRYDLSILKNISRFINKEQFDVVHTHGPRANFYVSLMKKRIAAKWVTTIHSDPFQDFTKQGLKGWIFTKLNLKALKDIDLFFVVTNRLKKSLEQLGISSEKMRVIYNGIEYDKEKAKGYDKKEKFHIEEDVFTAIQVARLHPVKGHEVLFDALNQTSLTKIKVLLVGDGPLEEDLKALAKEKGIEDKVQFLGHRQDVKQLFASAHINLLTSHSEGFPLVLLEAANQRVPSIVTRAGEIEPLIVDDTYGWVVPVGDGKALANALEQAYEKWKTGELAVMGKRIYEHAAANFSLNKLYEDTKETYKQLIAK
ncbi:glycosyltransferase [Bacillus cytotoxicus]|uniref:glycosyltransferase n=1 Tax=Bacillus cytotoxicus TaxID=580165 RepID=UPI00244B8D21|nr:glycosyltransferase [Bacillus cytotoxicus]MDH2880432.1 glycosyltransferase [Bacillus cytotoxicus]